MLWNRDMDMPRHRSAISRGNGAANSARWRGALELVMGSRLGKLLGRMGCEVTTLDNLSSGHRDAVLFGAFVEGDLADRALLAQLLQSGSYDAVMHFASFIQVGESVKDPAKYYENNVSNTLNLLDAIRTADVNRFIF